MASFIDVPVIIIGGGGCGLTLSSFLSDYGIGHYLFERHERTSIVPKAHYLNQRTMEIFRQHDMADEILKKSAPLNAFSQVAWATSLGGSGPEDRQLIHKRGCFGGEDEVGSPNVYKRDSAMRSANLPQIRMEPVFREMAEKRNPGKVLFKHEVTSFDDNGDSVTVTVGDAQGKEQTYRCQYLVGADGGRFVGPKLGIQMQGPRAITDLVSIHFRADLSEYWDERFFACHFINGSCSTVFESGAIVPMGPTWGKHSEEWIFHFGFEIDDVNRFAEERLVPRVRELLKIPNLEIDVLKISHWVLERVLADYYSNGGRILLAGDSAHRRPPTTGLGLNTCIEDSLNLAWKLALVLDGKADKQLLRSYESERKPIGRRNCDWGLFTFKNSSLINAAIGLIPGQKEANGLSFSQLFEDSEIGQSRRAQVRRIIDSQCIEFSAHGIELGFSYQEGFRVDDGTDAPAADPLGQDYMPTSRPGHRLPHAWIQHNNLSVSTHDLVGRDLGFLLITDPHGKDWVAVAQAAARTYNIPIKMAEIAPANNFSAEFRDNCEQWEKVSGLKRGGAIFVRPDNFVAWRSRGPSKRDGKELADAIEYLFNRVGESNVP